MPCTSGASCSPDTWMPLRAPPSTKFPVLDPKALRCCRGLGAAMLRVFPMALVSFTTYEVHLIQDWAPKAGPCSCAGSNTNQKNQFQRPVACGPRLCASSSQTWKKPRRRGERSRFHGHLEMNLTSPVYTASLQCQRASERMTLESHGLVPRAGFRSGPPSCCW